MTASATTSGVGSKVATSLSDSAIFGSPASCSGQELVPTGGSGCLKVSGLSM